MLNEDTSGARRYQDHVPAVSRAVRLLERLAIAGEARALADLARELEVGPSSLLAILTTLRHHGLVVRDQAGHYAVGPGLAALGQAAACKLRPCERFPAIAEALVAALGETVLLWVRQEDSFVLAASREGTQALRYVPMPGRRLRAEQTALSALAPCASDLTEPLGGAADTSMLPASLGNALEPPATVDEELLPGVWTLAAALPTGPGEQACVALAGPRERLETPAVRSVLLAVLGASGPEAIPDSPLAVPLSRASVDLGASPRERGPSSAFGASSTSGASGPIDADELDTFLGQSLVATLSYLEDDGFPATVPLWYAWDGASFWLAPRAGSEWAEHIRDDPRVSLAVSESTPPLRRVLVRGRLVEVDDPGGERWLEIEAQLAGRYAGFDAAREPVAAGRGRLLELKPERLIAWRGLLRHPKLPPGPPTPGSSSASKPGSAPGSTAWRNLG